MNIKDMSIEDRITNSKFYYFDDGYLGSTNHGASYYEGYDSLTDMNNIEMTGEDGLRSIDLNQEWYEEYVYEQDEDENGNNIPGMNYNEYWNKWFSDAPEYQIIDDSINGGNGYGKIVVNQNTKTITIMIVPCIYSIEGDSERDDTKIFGFDYNTGQLVREINDDDLGEIVSDEDLYIG